MKQTPSPPPATCAPAAFLSVCRWLRRSLFHDKAGDIVFRDALAPLALAAALLAIPADEARAHDDNSATLHAETYPLHSAAEAGDLDSVNHFLAVHMATINAKNAADNGHTPLHYAASRGHVSIVSTLIAAGADVNARDNDDETPLYDSVYSTSSSDGPFIQSRRVSVVSALIAAGADVNTKTTDRGLGSTPLHRAAVFGAVSIVSALIAAGAEVNAKDLHDWTPLHNAATYDHNMHVAVVSVLIAAGAEVNAKTKSGATPLHRAAYFNSPVRRAIGVLATAVVSMLIAAGAEVNARDNDGRTPLHSAATTFGYSYYDISGNVAVVSVLIAAGAEVNAKTNNFGWTPLYRAVAQGWHVAVVSALIAAGADVNARGNDGDTPLHWGVSRSKSIVSVLIAAGADVSAKDNDGETPLHYLSSHSHSGSFSIQISMLIAAGAEVNARDNDGRTPLYTSVGRLAVALIAAGGHWGEACANAAVVNPAGPSPPCICESPNVETNLGACEVVAVCDSPSVLNAGTNRCDCPAPKIGIDGADPPGDCHAENALHEAARTGDLDAVNHLITVHMADVNATTSYGETPLHKAAHNGPASIVSVLLAAGAEVSIKRSDGETPLHLAAGNGHADIASMLLSAGADVNAEDNYGNTPLHEPDNASVVSVLLAAGAEVNAKNQYGDTPLRDAASWAAGPLIISVLIAAGGHWGEACENAAVVNPAGPSPPCVCESPNVETNLGACEVVAECDSPSVLDAGTNRCDCPAPNVGTDGADAPGVCAVPSAQVCGGEDPPEYYAATLSACVPFADCRAGATLDGGTNTCECAPPSALDGTGLGCEFTSASCMAATLHYTGTACEPLADCTAPAVRNAATNLCECLAPNLDFGGADCRAPSEASCAEHYDPPKFYDQTAGECGDRLFPCHDSAIVKADNSGCECADGDFAHGGPSGGFWFFSRSRGEWRKSDTAECHADHAPIQHYINGWLDAVFGNNPTLVAHFISDHGQDPDGNNALHSAARNGYYSAAKALIEGGADIDRKRNGEAPLHMAVRNERGPLITLLLQRGANPDIADGDGDTPLHDAAQRTDTAENAGLIAFLLDAGADPNIRNDDGWRPLDLAYHGGTPSDLTWQARRGMMAALIAGGATWSDECTSGAIPNENYRPSSGIADCVCPLHISERDSRGRCECPAHSHAQVNGRCLPKDSAQVEAEIVKMEAELLRLRASLVSLNARLSAAADMPREAVEEIAEQAGETAQEIKRRRDNFVALARADLAGAPPPPVAMSDTAAECRMLGGEVQIHSATGIRVCSGIDANDTFCLVDSGNAYPCRGLFRHVRTCNDDYNRRALNPFFCGARCGERAARGDECE